VKLIPLPPADIALPKYDAMCRAIAECYRVDEVKDMRDKAEALRAYAKQAENREAEVQFAEVKVRAERKCGELLQMTAASGERETGGKPLHGERVKPTLKDLGVTEIQSHRFQQIANVPAVKVEAAFETARKTQVPVTSAQIRQLTKWPKSTPEKDLEQERLWRVLTALQEIYEQDITPEEWVAGLPDYMLNRATTHLKRARPWLEEFFVAWDKRHVR
jgi:hypothetical protein